MAMSDYYLNCYKIETEVISDGFGGYETVEYKGVEFRGLPVKKGETEQLVGALRGQEEVQYTFHCPINIPLKKDDKVAYVENGVEKYIRLSSEEIINTEQSMQTDWKSYNAESYVPTNIITKGKV